MKKMKTVDEIRRDWESNSRWQGVKRTYKAEDVVRLRGTVQLEYSLATRGAERLWDYFEKTSYVHALGALTGNQAMQMAKAQLKAIYLSGWQVAADQNNAGTMYPDQSLYPADSVPHVVKKINNALKRCDEIYMMEGKEAVDWFLPIVADAESGFGGVLNAFEIMKAMIDAGAAGVHFEDQLSSAKKCGHMGGKVLVPTKEAIQKLSSARLAADILDVPTILIARTDARGAKLLTSNIDENDKPFITSDEVTEEGFYRVQDGIEQGIARGLAYAPYADLLWMETSNPDLKEAKQFADAIHEKYPGKYLAYNCSPSFHWKQHLNEHEISTFQKELGEMGYKFQFITLAGFHSLNESMFTLADGYRSQGMKAYVELQNREFAKESMGYTATKHQREVGAGYFDAITQTVTAGKSSITALSGSTEEEQF